MQVQKSFFTKYVIVIVVAVIVIVAGLVWATKNNSSSTLDAQKSTKIQVVTSFYPLYFFTKEIGGNLVNVTNMTPSGSEPHDYEPTTQDIVGIQNSQLLVLNGGGLEAWGDKVSQIVNTGKTLVLTVGNDITTQTITEGGPAQIDPHIWLSPPLTMQIVDKIVAGFVQIDPTNSAYYEANAKTLKDKLAALDSEFRLGLATCAKKDIVTAHSAFGYLASAYNLVQVSIAGLSPDAEPSPRQLAGIVDLAKKNNIKYIFFESLTSPKLSQTIASEVGAQTLVLNPIEGLTPAEVAQGKDYFTEMESNLTNLQLALECAK